jgi:hypothetical protein
VGCGDFVDADELPASDEEEEEDEEVADSLLVSLFLVSPFDSPEEEPASTVEELPRLSVR